MRHTEAVGDLVRGGGLVRGEIVERWQRLAGVSDLARVASRLEADVRQIRAGRLGGDAERLSSLAGVLRALDE